MAFRESSSKASKVRLGCRHDQRIKMPICEHTREGERAARIAHLIPRTLAYGSSLIAKEKCEDAQGNQHPANYATLKHELFKRGHGLNMGCGLRKVARALTKAA